ncbi:class II aldolase/adducin family protein [Paenibacillus chitinolyticus]|uniref:class II aldolase/adducin family protein n=1 Tax=Paenibacillus chitinolyticus TaxID=79263 RepID=UPI0026E4D6B0|nr:class II aldolase/adducin family protein [Paenibacillus chitinolyticus]GKS09201.1 aldolase [Paenibacillus chitinolyticus]
MTERKIREELTKYAAKSVAKGLVVGPGGNISARSGEFMYLSPSGFALEDIEPHQWVPVHIPTGEIGNTDFRPSSEVLMHLFCYRANPLLQAIVHTHPAYCIALTLVDDELPMLFPDQAALVGDVAFIPYVVPTTDKLAHLVAEKADRYSSMLLKNHGLVTTGKNLREAYYRTEVMEESAKIYMIAKSVGEPRRLTEEEYKEIQGLESEAYRVQLLQNMKE